ncbi:ATP-binding protein [Brevibacillus migulae]|uniref:ATP-binding protein n=1 Tax=Brevibacillus migulae TaxID=1644114 RepID=UPI001F3D83A4|nr:ATP-binding protein [Brevibacillus migulae]
MKKKTVLIVLLFLIAITGIRLSVLSMQKPINQPFAVNGKLDLRGFSIPEKGVLRLNGEWEFFPSQLVKPDSATITSIAKRTHIQVPGPWEGQFPENDDQTFRYGTYRLQIILDKAAEQTLQLKISEIRTASAVYVNGHLVEGAGQPSEQEARHLAKNVPYTVLIQPGSNVIELMIQVSNHAGNGGITQPIYFGSLEAVNRHASLSMGLQLLLSIVFFVHAAYAIMLYFLGAANRGLLYFSLLILCAIVSVLTVDDKLLLIWFDFPYGITVKIAILSYIGVASFLPPFLYYLFPAYGNLKVIRWFGAVCLAYAALVFFAPSAYVVYTALQFLGLYLLASLIISGYILQSAFRKEKDVIYLLLACTSLAVNIIWTSLEKRLGFEMMHYPFDLIITIFCFAGFWFKRFFRANTQATQLAEKLQLADKQKDDFLVNTSHELRNPLHGIINITQSVLDDRTNPVTEEHRNRLEIQIAVARRMALMLDDLLDVTRLKEKTVRLQIRSIRLQSVVTGILEMLRFMLDGKPLQLHVDIAEHFPTVKADENRLIQIMFNLLHNAIKFTDKGHITIRATVENQMAHIHVADTGIGMDEETQQRIFFPYEQGHSELTTAVGGFGLGLSICKQLVELHGGSISVMSSPGEGTVFTFTLPLSAEDALPAEAELFSVRSYDESAATSSLVPDDMIAASTVVETNKPTLLIVDDDPLNLKILVDILGTAQYNISTATSASEALRKLESGPYDLIVSDVMMPHISGYELTRMIRERYSLSELPIVLLTARNRPEDILVGFQSGANDYVTKPVDSMELRSRVRALTALKLSIEEQLRIEAAFLQAQIQPHFLFNTLNSIASLGTMDTPRMLALLEEFSKYLRISFDFQNAERVIPLERELTLVRSYLYIEKERHGERIEVLWNLAPRISIPLPPLSIQTLVENALHHGILNRTSGGRIEIQITDIGNSIEVCIRDNGVGMSEEKQKQVFEKLAGAAGTSGIGLRNTDRRLKQLYGTGLRIESVLGQGTAVAFQIPKKE